MVIDRAQNNGQSNDNDWPNLALVHLKSESFLSKLFFTILPAMFFEL